MISLLLLLVIPPMLVSSESSKEAVAQVPQPSAPYLVSLRQTSEDEEAYCAGTIISARAILTSAYCLQSFGEEEPQELLKVVVGTNELDSGESYGIDKLVIHKNYYINEDNYTIHDVGIIFTDEEIQFSDKVWPVLVRESPVEDKEELRVIGWGSDFEDEPHSNELLEVKVTVVNNDVCRKAAMICALPDSEQSLCDGVSGGPLVDLKGRLVGVVKSGEGTCDTGYPVLYTSVHAYLPWIKEVLLLAKEDLKNQHYYSDNSDEDGDNDKYNDDDEQVTQDATTTDNYLS